MSSTYFIPEEVTRHATQPSVPFLPFPFLFSSLHFAALSQPHLNVAESIVSAALYSLDRQALTNVAHTCTENQPGTGTGKNPL